jgi:hypothetical protein
VSTDQVPLQRPDRTPSVSARRMLSAARDSKRSPEIGDFMLQIELVAAARNQLYLEFLLGCCLAPRRPSV